MSSTGKARLIEKEIRRRTLGEDGVNRNKGQRGRKVEGRKKERIEEIEKQMRSIEGIEVEIRKEEEKEK